MEEKKYKSAGAALTKQDFKGFIDYFNQAEITGDLVRFKETPEGLPSELDKVLFALPKYLLKKNENNEDTSELVEYASEAIDLLLYYGANPNANFKNSITPFLKACELPNSVFVRKLIENVDNPAILDTKDGQGNKALFYATMAESLEVIDYLVKELNVNINHQYILSNQQTVFHYACGHVKEKSIDKLMELGIDPTLKDANGSLAGEFIPAYDPDVHDEDEFTPEQLQLWDDTFEKVQEYTKLHTKEKNNNKSKKTIF